MTTTVPLAITPSTPTTGEYGHHHGLVIHHNNESPSDPGPDNPPPFDRTYSSPPMPSSTRPQDFKTDGSLQAPRRRITALLTPPTSPRQTKSSTDLAGLVTPERVEKSALQLPAGGTFPERFDSTIQTSVSRSRPLSDLIECPFDVEIVKDSSGRDQEFGRGVWSTVYRALSRERLTPTSFLLTPPSSPITTLPLLVAVKTPARPDAKAILRNEATVLGHIFSTRIADAYVVPFYGFLPSTGSLVLGAVPLDLQQYIKACAFRSSGKPSTGAVAEPILGSAKAWLFLAECCIRALAWLHTAAGGAGVVHGDIKPGNVLLSPNHDVDSGFAFTPLLADFSSSQLLSSSTISPNTLSAVTREYTAPELLSSAVLKNPNSVATTASDVFSLAVTLLVAATGEVMVYAGSSVWQRVTMATQGWNVLDNVRNGDQGCRVPRYGIVDRVLERAVLKAGMGRIDATRWVRLVEEMKVGEPTKST